MDILFQFKGANAVQEAFQMKYPISLKMEQGEHWLLVGGNGGGKSLFTDMLSGVRIVRPEIEYGFVGNGKKKVYEAVKCITFCDAYGGKIDDGYYYQQRWNRIDLPEDMPRVEEVILSLPALSTEWREQLVQVLQLDKLYHKEIISLSSGELRRLMLGKALLNAPNLLILDAPFIGLDREMRAQMLKLLEVTAQTLPIQFILSEAFPKEIPSFITHVVEVEDRAVKGKVSREEWIASQKGTNPIPTKDAPDEIRRHVLKNQAMRPFLKDDSSLNIIDMENIRIAYNENILLDNFSWRVRRGEKWGLTGRNGSGKSTLISLICADNPQGYSCNLSLFGRKRGTGESIWDIKKRIGYVSPELHRGFKVPNKVKEVVASGFFDTIGLYRRPSEEQLLRVEEWIRTFDLEHLEERPFNTLSSGEQRRVLLCRAFVKDPDLLILDEPFHGLDRGNTSLAKEIIEQWASREDKTLLMVSHYEEDFPSCLTHHLNLERRKK